MHFPFHFYGFGFALLLALISLCAWQENTSQNENPIVDVYVAGSEGNIAKYWKNGVAVNLTDGSKKALAHSIAIDGKDIHVAGFEFEKDTIDLGLHIAKYWKNGVSFNLNDNTNAEAYSIKVSGKDVYIAGFENKNEVDDKDSHSLITNDVAQYWKNGVAIQVGDGSKDSEAFDITIMGKDVYLTGYESYQIRDTNSINIIHIAKYWKNGVGFNLNDSSVFAEPLSIALSGKDVYIAGYQNSIAKYWKNGRAVSLSDNSLKRPHNLNSCYANSIVISEGDIYIAGNEVNSNFGKNPYYTAKYWKNGQAINLSEGHKEVSANSIAVSGSDVYVAGSEGNIAKYWKNGVAVNLTDGSKKALAHDIKVIPRNP